MIKLRTYFDLSFDDPKISDANLRMFTEDHLQRLISHNASHGYDALIAATAQAHNDYFGAMTGTATHASLQKSLTRAMNRALEEFRQRVSRREGVIRDLWDKDSPEYAEFFPRGLTEYSQMTLGTAESLMTRFINACMAHKDKLGQPYVDLFTKLAGDFKSSRTAQLGKKGAVSESKTAKADARATLERQLSINVLTLAIEFLGNADAGMAFFDQSIIRPPESTPQPAAAPPPPPVPTPAPAPRAELAEMRRG